jgi:hypothetical protein
MAFASTATPRPVGEHLPYVREMNHSSPLRAGLWAGGALFPEAGLRNWVLKPNLGSSAMPRLAMVGDPRWNDGLQFDGDDAASYDYAIPLGLNYPLSFACTFRLEATPSAAMAALAMGENSGFGALVFVGVSSTGTANYRIRMVDSGSINDVQGGTVTVGKTVSVVGVSRTSSDHRLFLNGHEVATDTTLINEGSAAWQHLTLGMLRRGSDSSHFTGTVFSWGVWTRGLSDADVKLWHRGDLFTTRPRVSYFDLGAGTVLPIFRHHYVNQGITA